MSHDRLWSQLVEGVSHIILSRRDDVIGSGRVPYAFEVFHMDISESDGVSEMLQQLEINSGMGVIVGLYITNKKESGQRTTTTKTKLLECWRLQQAKIPRQNKRVNDLTNVRLLIRSIYATCRMLPYHRCRSKLWASKGSSMGFFISPIETWDSQSSVITGCATDPELVGTQLRFDTQVERKSFAPVAFERRGNSYSATVSVEYTDFFPELETSLDEGSPKFSIIGDYVNRRPESASIPVPFAKSQPQQMSVPTSSSAPRDPGSKSMPVQIPVKAQHTPPPSFAPTPPGSFQSGSSLTKLFQHGGFHRFESVSPSESSLSQWTPRLDNNSVGNTAAVWVPKTKEIPIKKYGSSHIEVNTYSAFLEDDVDDELIDDGSDSLIETTDDDISKFRERMETVTLTEGFATLNPRGEGASPFAIRGTDKPMCISDIAASLQELRHEFMSATEGKA